MRSTIKVKRKQRKDADNAGNPPLRVLFRTLFNDFAYRHIQTSRQKVIYLYEN